jgi:hypothetical protein
MHVSSRNMFPTTRNLQICVHVYRPHHYCGDWLTFGCFVPMIADHNLVKKSFGPMIYCITRHETDRFLNNHCQECVHAYLSIHDCLSFLHEVMIGNHRTKTFLHEVMIAIILMWYTQNIYIFFFINWTLRMSDNLPERVQILCRAHIICITVLENREICCQIFCDLLLKSAFEQIFNVMQLILVKIKWHTLY